MLYWIFYIMMLIGYLGVSLLVPGLKIKTIGILLVMVNALIFWRG